MGEQKFRKVIFFDRAAELDPKDKQELEAMGFLVVILVGNPHHVLSTYIEGIEGIV